MTELFLSPADLVVGDRVTIPTGDDTPGEIVTVEAIEPQGPDSPMTVSILSGGAWRALPAEAQFQVERA